ncbi:hypothetical protein [Streptomyces sp. NPDC055632]
MNSAKSDAIARRQASTRLNQLPGGPGSNGQAGLVVNQDDLGVVGHEASVKSRRGWHMTLVGGVAVLTGLVAGCSESAGNRGPAVDRSSGQVSRWAAGATVESVAGALHVRLPPTATEAKAARLEGLQDDGLIMAFVLPTAEVDGFVAQLDPEEPLTLRERPLARNTNPSTPFSHLGLPEPDLSAKVREGQVCAPCKENLDWLKIAVTRVDAHTSRVYLSGAD